MSRQLLPAVLVEGLETILTRLMHALQQFMRADTRSAACRVIEEHPELLSGNAELMLSQLIAGARSEGNQQVLQLLEEHRTLLRRCREDGPEHVFGGRPTENDGPGDPHPPLDFLQTLPPEQRDALRTIFTNARSPEELEAVLHAHPELRTALEIDMALAAAPTGEQPPLPAELPEAFRQAANAIERYERIGDQDALTQALAAWRHILAHPGFAASPERFRALVLSGAGVTFLAQYKVEGHAADLEQAIAHWQQAVQLASLTIPERAGSLSNLSVALRTRYAQTNHFADLEQAITYGQQAVDLTPSPSATRAHSLSILGNGLHERYARLGNLADLDQAIEYHRQAVDLTASPVRTAYMSNLGLGLRDRYARTGNLADLNQARQVFQQACELGLDVNLEVALGSSQTWGDWALAQDDWKEAARAFAYGLQALEQLFRNQLLRASKEAWLLETRGLPAHAAYAMAHAGDLPGAVVALEQGRARLLAEVLERDRTDLEALRSTHTGLYERYQRTAARMAWLEGGELRPDTLPLGFDLTAEIRSARAELNAAMEAIRGLDGYKNFLKSPSFADIQTAAGAVPIVYVAATKAGGLALILRPYPTAAITPVWLPALKEDILRERVQEYLWAYAQRQQDRDGWLTALEEMTHWLWETLMGELVETLAPVARATLIPVGLLGLLPLHAAWTKEPAAPSGRRYALDAVALTYSPNARALAVAQAIAVETAPEALLAVDEPQPVHAAPLPNSAHEVLTAIDTFSRHRICRHGDATRQAVLTALPQNPVCHFSCHGYANVGEPLASGLLMANDELLTLRDFLELRLAGVRLAILSACETAIPGIQLPDEVVSLPTGLLQAGVAGVVASLWSVSGISTMMLLAHFYELWRKEEMEPTEALRRAQRWVRDTTNGQKRDYFRGSLPEFHGSGMPAAVASALYQACALLPSEHHDYAHPYDWAAFAYVGV